MRSGKSFRHRSASRREGDTVKGGSENIKHRGSLGRTQRTEADREKDFLKIHTRRTLRRTGAARIRISKVAVEF